MKLETFSAYQRESRKTWSRIYTDHPIVYPTLGLANEAGEVAGKIKKIFRDKGGKISEEGRSSTILPYPSSLKGLGIEMLIRTEHLCVCLAAPVAATVADTTSAVA
jgi:hypothetical protein